MGDWTFGALKARNMALEAYCQNAECRRFFAFDVDALLFLTDVPGVLDADRRRIAELTPAQSRELCELRPPARAPSRTLGGDKHERPRYGPALAVR